MSRTRWMTALLAASLVACGGAPEDQRTETLDAVEAQQEREAQSPELLQHLDAGNEAYRAGDYEGALEQYTAAVEVNDAYAAAWFGIYMAQKALGNVEEAERALEAARAEAPGATLIHPTVEDTVP